MFLPLGLLLLFAAAVAIIVTSLGVVDRVDLDTDVTVGIGGCMALLLAFRLNVCLYSHGQGSNPGSSHLAFSQPV